MIASRAPRSTPRAIATRMWPAERNVRPPLRTLTAAVSAVVLLAGCTGGDDGGDHGDGGGAGSAAPAPSEIADADGYWRASGLPAPKAEAVVQVPTEDGRPSRAKLQILSLDSDGTNARMVAAWVPPVSGAAASSAQLVAERQQANRRPWVRLLDSQARTLTEPLQVDGKDSAWPTEPQQVTEAEPSDDAYRKSQCACSYLYESDEAGQKPEKTQLFYVDFPAPQGDHVSVLAGDGAAALEGVEVTQGERFHEDPSHAAFKFVPSDWGEALPQAYGAGAVRKRVLPLDAQVDSVTDAAVDDRGSSVRLNIGADVLFALDSDRLDRRAQRALDSIATRLKDSARGQRVTVQGHTDDQGEPSYNDGLSKRRAEAVRAALEPKTKSAGVTYATEGFGEKRPLVPNKDGSGAPIERNRAKNRRVTFEFKPVKPVDPQIDTGRKVKDLPALKKARDGEALATAVLPAPRGGRTPALHLAVSELVEAGDYLRLKYSFATADGRLAADAFASAGGQDRARTFGTNPYTTEPGYPTASNLQLWDKDAKLLAGPVMAGGADCLCAQVGDSVKPRTASGTPEYMYAYFPKAGLKSQQLTLRIAQTGQLTVPRGTTPIPDPTAGASGLASETAGTGAATAGADGATSAAPSASATGQG